MSCNARQRQGLVPDLLDMRRNVLMDVKMFAWGNYYRPIRFHKAKTCRAVKFRAKAVDKEYRRKAKNVDVKYNKWIAPVQDLLKKLYNNMAQSKGSRSEFMAKAQRTC